ncbi:hypothetical protein [Rhizobium aegyptiacum]|uniref:hypothetical protein n=1 Tax=Rhizobium aegyptiacum TaxID=1764550 RepID=UPI00142E898C|nr:hypothetical protein [Rhizobium aegyptiacum]
MAVTQAMAIWPNETLFAAAISRSFSTSEVLINALLPALLRLQENISLAIRVHRLRRSWFSRTTQQCI